MATEFTIHAEAESSDLCIRVSAFTGYSGAYTYQSLEELETLVRKFLDNKFGYLNDTDNNSRNYEIIRRDFVTC